MRLHCLQHVPFEDPGYIMEWAAARSFSLGCSRLYAGEHPPAPDQFDWLVVMGGPMGIHDHTEYPWLAEEKVFIKETIEAGRTVIGICLGAQLTAHALGARVYPGRHKEIGWFPLKRAAEAPEWFPEEITAFHWHGDTFDLPDGAVRLASSEACRYQGFIYRDRVVGLQFHMESTQDSIENLIRNCGGELTGGPFIQTAREIRSAYSNIAVINAALSRLLEKLPTP